MLWNKIFRSISSIMKFQLELFWRVYFVQKHFKKFNKKVLIIVRLRFYNSHASTVNRTKEKNWLTCRKVTTGILLIYNSYMNRVIFLGLTCFAHFLRLGEYAERRCSPYFRTFYHLIGQINVHWKHQCSVLFFK